MVIEKNSSSSKAVRKGELVQEVLETGAAA